MKVPNHENEPLDHAHAPPLKISLSLYTVKKPSRRDPTEILSISSRYPTHVPQSEAHEAQRWKVRHNMRYNLRVQSNRSIPHTFNVT